MKQGSIAPEFKAQVEELYRQEQERQSLMIDLLYGDNDQPKERKVISLEGRFKVKRTLSSNL